MGPATHLLTQLAQSGCGHSCNPRPYSAPLNPSGFLAVLTIRYGDENKRFKKHPFPRRLSPNYRFPAPANSTSLCARNGREKNNTATRKVGCGWELGPRQSGVKAPLSRVSARERGEERREGAAQSPVRRLNRPSRFLGTWGSALEFSPCAYSY